MNKELTLPIRLYAQNRVVLLAIVFIVIILTVYFADILFYQFPVISAIAKIFFPMLICLKIIFPLYIFSKKMASIIIYQDRIEILNGFYKSYQVFYFSDIKSFEYSIGRFKVLKVYLKNRPILYPADKIYRLADYYRVHDMQMHCKQILDIINQVFENYQNNTQNPIILKEVNKRFSIWD